MEEKISQLKKAFIEKYPKARIAYASKAFLNKAMVGLIKAQGLSLNAVSLGELQIALKAGMDAQDIEFSTATINSLQSWNMLLNTGLEESL